MKKVLSIILLASMILAMMPTTFAAVGAETGAITYTFAREAFGSTSSLSKADAIGIKNMGSGYNEWYIEGVSWAYNLSIGKDRMYISTKKIGDTSDTADVAMALNINTTGTFVPTIGYQEYNFSPINDIYLIKKSVADDISGYNNASDNKVNEKLEDYISANCSSAVHLGRIDMCGDNTSASKTLNTVNITEPGWYYLIVAYAGTAENFKASDDKYAITYLTSFTLTPAETDEAVISAYELDGSAEASHSASITPLAAALNGSTITTSVSAKDEDGDGVYKITADEADATGDYKFLYWIKGLTSDTANKIVSLTPTIEEYKPQNGANYLIAVYEKAGSESSVEPKFYNGNGQLLDDLKLGENGELPALPSMAGYGDAKEWKKHNDSIYVAQYDDFKVKVNGDDVTYGDSVTFTAEDDTDGKYFKWWTRTVDGVTEIVSTDREYTFCPWEDCTVTAVCGTEKQIMAGSLRKIVLDVLGTDSIMAEFIGLDGAEVVEKGIMLGTKKIAMSTNSSQFTITNNISATSASGYAIIKDGTTVTEITDGTVALNK